MKYNQNLNTSLFKGVFFYLCQKDVIIYIIIFKKNYMKKIIQVLMIIILLMIISLIIIFVFNPLNLRTKIIGSIINSYLSSTIEEYTPLDNNSSGSTDTTTNSTQIDNNDKHPLLNETQEKTLESYGVDVEKLPQTVTPEMEKCFVEKLGEARAKEIVGGATPSAMEILKARACLGE